VEELLMMTLQAALSEEQAIRPSPIIICTHTEYILYILSLSLCCKRATNYDASLVFQDAVVKSTFFLFSPVSVIPDARQRVRAVPGFGFGGKGGKKGRGLVCPNNELYS
jgi:hypothetical protein